MIRLYNEHDYHQDSVDNAVNYHKQHFGSDSREVATSQIGIKILRDDREIDNCIILATGGATTVHRSSTLIDNDKLVCCCGDSVFCLELPGLSLLWTVNADLATYFQIFNTGNDYVVHGELVVSSLDKSGQINWQFGGADIFVSDSDQEAFIMDSDGITLRDFSDKKYRIDFNGRQLWQV